MRGSSVGCGDVRRWRSPCRPAETEDCTVCGVKACGSSDTPMVSGAVPADQLCGIDRECGLLRALRCCGLGLSGVASAVRAEQTPSRGESGDLAFVGASGSAAPKIAASPKSDAARAATATRSAGPVGARTIASPLAVSRTAMARIRVATWEGMVPSVAVSLHGVARSRGEAMRARR